MFCFGGSVCQRGILREHLHDFEGDECLKGGCSEGKT